jgi:hypothetical protein
VGAGRKKRFKNNFQHTEAGFEYNKQNARDGAAMRCLRILVSLI